MNRTELLAACQSIQSCDTEERLEEIASRLKHETLTDDERSEIGVEWLLIQEQLQVAILYCQCVTL